MRCDCENGHCQVGHRLGGCDGAPTVKALYGRLCTKCAAYMPSDYLMPQNDGNLINNLVDLVANVEKHS
jgi:hypothetical protein